jgi:uncharacterized membrane protein required for colicin V production
MFEFLRKKKRNAMLAVYAAVTGVSKDNAFVVDHEKGMPRPEDIVNEKTVPALLDMAKRVHAQLEAEMSDEERTEKDRTQERFNNIFNTKEGF